MKFIIFLAIIIALFLHFKDEIHNEVVGELKSIPAGVAKYNVAELGVDQLRYDGKVALEIEGFCKQYPEWRTENITRIFAQNCLNAESLVQ